MSSQRKPSMREKVCDMVTKTNHIVLGCQLIILPLVSSFRSELGCLEFGL